MAITIPTGRPGPPTTDTPGKEKKARSGSGYDSGVKAGFGLSAGGMDETPVKAKSPVHVGREKLPDMNMTPSLGSVNKNEK